MCYTISVESQGEETLLKAYIVCHGHGLMNHSREILILTQMGELSWKPILTTLYIRHDPIVPKKTHVMFKVIKSLSLDTLHQILLMLLKSLPEGSHLTFRLEGTSDLHFLP